MTKEKNLMHKSHLNKYNIYCEFFLFYFLTQDLTTCFRLALNSLYSLGWP